VNKDIRQGRQTCKLRTAICRRVVSIIMSSSNELLIDSWTDTRVTCSALIERRSVTLGRNKVIQSSQYAVNMRLYQLIFTWIRVVLVP